MLSDRRLFLKSSLGLAATSFVSGRLSAADVKPFDPKILFLTWQRDPTTTITVQWVGDDEEPSQRAVSYVAHGEEVWQAVIPAKRPYPRTNNLHVYRAELTGLKPGTEYRFQLGKTSPVYRFRTMPEKLTNTFTFVSGGDCGINHNTIETNQLAARQDPMFALIGGDLGYDNGHDVGISLAFMENYRKHMIDSHGRLIPLLVCLGNHEVQGGYSQPREKAPFFFALHDGLYAEHSYAALDFGDYLSLVLLDSGHISRIEGQQTAWLNQTLAERSERPHVIAASHVPAYPSHREYDEGNLRGAGSGNRKHWSPLFEKHNLDLVLEHHDHTFKRTFPLKGGHIDKNGLVYLGDGSWGRLRPPIPLEKRPYLAKVEMAYHLTVHRLEGAERFHIAMAEGGRVADVTKTIKRPTRPTGRGAPT